MKINKINLKNRQIINRFFNEKGMGKIVEDMNFSLLDESPNKDYFSYYVEVIGRTFGLIISFEENQIVLHKNNEVKLFMKF